MTESAVPASSDPAESERVGRVWRDDGVGGFLERDGVHMAGQTVPARQRIVVPFTGQVIGEGFNSDTAERVGTALSVGRVGEDPIAPGQTAAFKFQMLTSQASLEKALNIGAEIEARYALFSAGGKFSFAESSAINSTSTYIVASCVVTNALRFGADFQPNASAAPLIAAGKLDDFKTAFGDRFTQALHTGGEFHALVRATSSDVRHQQRIAASLHAELNGLFTSGSFKGSLETAQQDTSSHTEVDIQIHQTGGVGAQVQIPGTDADRIREHMNRFAAAAHQNAAAYQAELVSYDILALPFPPLEELEERRRVLEDCLARRQQYFSIISDLTFAQSEEAPLFFEGLASPEQLVALQNDFRRVLNDLMAHARKVSRGLIEPAFFVAEDEPPPPRFKRRTAGNFASWWARAKANDATLLQDEKVLIDRIAAAAGPLMSVPVAEASPETMERAADLIEVLHLESPDPPNRHLSSIGSLPKMIDAPLRKIFASSTNLGDLAGLERFSRLELLVNTEGTLRDIRALAAAAGIQDLRLRDNVIADLSPLQGLTTLEVLCVQGNQIQSLDPLRELKSLRTVSVASADGLSLTSAHTGPVVDVDPFAGFLDNPIEDARALAELPRLSNPLTSAEHLRLRLFEIFFDENENLTAPQQRGAGVATRVRDTNRFQFVPDERGDNELIMLMGLTEWNNFLDFPAPVVVTGVHFPRQGVGVACTRPDDRSATLPAVELVDFWLGSGVDFEAKFLTGGMPHLFLEVEPA
jgi:hypothetical protein